LGYIPQVQNHGAGVGGVKQSKKTVADICESENKDKAGGKVNDTKQMDKPGGLERYSGAYFFRREELARV
jgi:hypothetical protein